VNLKRWQVIRSDSQGVIIDTRRFWRRRSAVEWQEYVYAYTHDRTELRRRWPI